VVLQLAHIYNSGSGVEANCSMAAGYVRVVLHERRGWSDDIAEAVRSLDEGEPDAFNFSLLLIYGCGRCPSSVNGVGPADFMLSSISWVSWSLIGISDSTS